MTLSYFSLRPRLPRRRTCRSCSPLSVVQRGFRRTQSVPRDYLRTINILLSCGLIFTTEAIIVFDAPRSTQYPPTLGASIFSHARIHDAGRPTALRIPRSRRLLTCPACGPPGDRPKRTFQTCSRTHIRVVSRQLGHNQYNVIGGFRRVEDGAGVDSSMS